MSAPAVYLPDEPARIASPVFDPLPLPATDDTSLPISAFPLLNDQMLFEDAQATSEDESRDAMSHDVPLDDFTLNLSSERALSSDARSDTFFFEFPSMPDTSHPLNDSYETREDLKKALTEYAHGLGFALTTIKSTEGVELKLGCSRYGKHRERHSSANEQRKAQKIADETYNARNRTTMKSGCQYFLYARADKDGHWSVTKKREDHNHDLADPLALWSLRQPDGEEKVWLLRQLANLKGIDAGNLLRSFSATFPREATGNRPARPPMIKRDIENIVAKYYKDLRGNLSPMNFALQLLPKINFESSFETDANGAVTCVFFMHADMLDNVRRHPSVFVLDCTYKINKWKMPLLEIIGIDSCKKSFFGAWALLCSEEQSNYEWALRAFKNTMGEQAAAKVRSFLTDRELALMNALQVVFPSADRLLCTWHIGKNVETHLVSFLCDTRSHDGFSYLARNAAAVLAGWMLFRTLAKRSLEQWMQSPPSTLRETSVNSKSCAALRISPHLLTSSRPGCL